MGPRHAATLAIAMSELGGWNAPHIKAAGVEEQARVIAEGAQHEEARAHPKAAAANHLPWARDSQEARAGLGIEGKDRGGATPSTVHFARQGC